VTSGFTTSQQPPGLPSAAPFGGNQFGQNKEATSQPSVFGGSAFGAQNPPATASAFQQAPGGFGFEPNKSSFTAFGGSTGGTAGSGFGFNVSTSNQLGTGFGQQQSTGFPKFGASNTTIPGQSTSISALGSGSSTSFGVTPSTGFFGGSSSTASGNAFGQQQTPQSFSTHTPYQQPFFAPPTPAQPPPSLALVGLQSPYSLPIATDLKKSLNHIPVIDRVKVAREKAVLGSSIFTTTGMSCISLLLCFVGLYIPAKPASSVLGGNHLSPSAYAPILSDVHRPLPKIALGSPGSPAGGFGDEEPPERTSAKLSVKVLRLVGGGLPPPLSATPTPGSPIADEKARVASGAMCEGGGETTGLLEEQPFFPASSSSSDFPATFDSGEKPQANVKLLHPEYRCSPSIEDINKMTTEQQKSIENFKIWRIQTKDDLIDTSPIVASVEWPGLSDVSGLDLDAVVHIEDRHVTVYPEEACKPSVGEKLNKRARISIYNCFPKDRTDPEQLRKHEAKLQRSAEGMKFISYDRNTGEWKFEVDHFTRYGLDNLYSDEETEDIGCDRPHHVVLAQNSLVKPPYKRQTRDNFSHVLGLDPRRIRFLQRFLFCKTCESQLMNFFPFSQSPPPSIYKMKYEHSLLPVEPSGAGTEEKETSWMPCYVAPEQQQLLQVPPPFANSQFYRRDLGRSYRSAFRLVDGVALFIDSRRGGGVVKAFALVGTLRTKCSPKLKLIPRKFFERESLYKTEKCLSAQKLLSAPLGRPSEALFSWRLRSDISETSEDTFQQAATNLCLELASLEESAEGSYSTHMWKLVAGLWRNEGCNGLDNAEEGRRLFRFLIDWCTFGLW
jgi:hypothetical protein